LSIKKVQTKVPEIAMNNVKSPVKGLISKIWGCRVGVWLAALHLPTLPVIWH